MFYSAFEFILHIFSAFLFLLLVFVPLERTFTIHKQAFFREEWLLDLCFFLGQYLIWNSLVFYLIDLFDVQIQAVQFDNIKTAIQSQPIWLQSLEVILLSDVLIYWAHRFQHKNDFLWRFHKTHHTSVRMDWLAAHREHPIDTIYTVTLINLPAILLGFNLESVQWFVLFRGIWAVYIHSNAKINIGFFKYIIGSPEMHHWHHDAERDRGNYANLSPLMDLIFGTHYDPGHFPNEYGVKNNQSKNYLQHLVFPFTKKK